MKFFLKALLLLVFTGLFAVIQVQAQKAPNTFVLDGQLLLQNKQKAEAGNSQHLQALQKLITNANNILARKPYSIVNKPITPPSGSKNDYLSLAPYWWPNPITSDGLPYINKDGRTNPEVKQIKDKNYVLGISNDIELLGLAYYFTGQEKYAKKATELLCVFFIDKDTKMNPNLNYGQAIRGITDGRAVGLIETNHFVRLIDGVQLLSGSESWTLENHKALQNWFGQFSDWMLYSPVGTKGVESDNNIGTYYDLQVVTYELFSGDKASAKSYLQNTSLKRIAVQFERDGRQPLEIKRTRSWTYCIKNLQGWCKLASIGEKTGIDIWNYSTPDGKSLKKGFLWMLPYANGQKQWNFKEISGVKLEWYLPLAKTASAVYKDQELQSYLSTPTLSAKAYPGKNILIQR